MTEKVSNTNNRFLIFIGIAVICALLGFVFKIDPETIKQFFSAFPVYVSGLIFIVIYVLSTTLLWVGAKDILKLLCASYFGVTTGFILLYIGEFINAIIMFLMARILGREYVVSRLSQKDKDRITTSSKETGFFGAFVLRINPLVPYRILDIVSGLSKISFPKFLIVYIVGAPVRLYWLVLTLATVMPIFVEKMPLIVRYLQEDVQRAQEIILDIMFEYMHVFVFSLIYFLAVLILSVIAIIIKYMRKKK